MRNVLLMLAVLLIAAGSASAMFDVVGEGSEGSWYIQLLANTEGWNETSYHVFLYDGAPAGFGTNARVVQTGWESRLVNSHYLQFWAIDPIYRNTGSIRFDLGGPSPDTFPVWIEDIECNGDPNDLNVTAHHWYRINSGSSITEVYPDNVNHVPNLAAPSDQSPEPSVCLLLLASVAGGMLVRRRE